MGAEGSTGDSGTMEALPCCELVDGWVGIGVEAGEGDSDGVGDGDSITFERERCKPRRKRGAARVPPSSSEESASLAESLNGL